MEKYNRRSIQDKLSKYDYLKDKDKYSFIEVTEWSNREGYDISVETDSESKILSLTNGELEAINYLTKTLQFNNE